MNFKRILASSFAAVALASCGVVDNPAQAMEPAGFQRVAYQQADSYYYGSLEEDDLSIVNGFIVYVLSNRKPNFDWDSVDDPNDLYDYLTIKERPPVDRVIKALLREENDPS